MAVAAISGVKSSCLEGFGARSDPILLGSGYYRITSLMLIELSPAICLPRPKVLDLLSSSMSSSDIDISELLSSASNGDRDAANELFQIVYLELKHLANSQMEGEPLSNLLQPTALVHEVWLRLLGDDQDHNWNDRRHFLASVAQGMRRVLVDSARARHALKRGGKRVKFELREDDGAIICDEEILALDEALDLLRVKDPKKTQLVELRYFAGLTIAQAAEQLDISTATAERYWVFSRAWLRAKLDE